jgi:hypothetical protein
MSNAAQSLWADVYPEITLDRPGTWGIVTARGEAQVLRLALTYASLDGADMIGQQHIEAGLALWRYAEQGAAMIFADHDVDPDGTRLLVALRTGPMTRSEIADLFSRHRGKQIDALLRRLVSEGKIEEATLPTRGRPSRQYRLCR